MEHFTYHSEEIKAGPQGSQRNIVNVKNGSGSKAVVKYNAKGAITKKATKSLTKVEIKNIKERKFMPGLFKDCSGKVSKMRSQTRKVRKSRF